MTDTPPAPPSDPEFQPGLHVLMDFYGAKFLTDQNGLEHALNIAAEAAGARIIDSKFHGFPGRAGVTGVVLLAESHISIHTWPELNYAAIDIFMCGSADAMLAAASLKEQLEPVKSRVTPVARGVDHLNQ